MPLGGFLMEKRGKPPSDYSSSKITPVEVKGCVTALPALQAPESTKPGPDYYAGITYVASLGIYVPRSKRDELVLKLAPSVNSMQQEWLQVWTDWANQKVKQATSRLLKDQPELKALRKEKEEAEELRK
ncbi:unnamed protein product [Brassica oleracea var. botrytis]|uniref:Uncharacterized protein n=1 Tax=Brassica oleracea TaxID=3712 RepID=A0A3P6DDC5_BRAOL|nr:unnamed protein product [Brassica oleracea]